MDRSSRRLSRGRAALETEYQRTYKACIPCARRKVKCEFGGNGKCCRCVKKNLDCIFNSKKPWSRAQNSEVETPRRQRNESDVQGRRSVWHRRREWLKADHCRSQSDPRGTEDVNIENSKPSTLSWRITVLINTKPLSKVLQLAKMASRRWYFKKWCQIIQKPWIFCLKQPSKNQTVQLKMHRSKNLRSPLMSWPT